MKGASASCRDESFIALNAYKIKDLIERDLVHGRLLIEHGCTLSVSSHGLRGHGFVSSSFQERENLKRTCCNYRDHMIELVGVNNRRPINDMIK